MNALVALELVVRLDKVTQASCLSKKRVILCSVLGSRDTQRDSVRLYDLWPHCGRRRRRCRGVRVGAEGERT